MVLIDLVMPGMDEAEATRLFRAQHPEIQVVALASSKEKELVEGALDVM
jgi:DNA-binding NarL/FixJ family response regulator